MEAAVLQFKWSRDQVTCKWSYVCPVSSGITGVRLPFQYSSVCECTADRMLSYCSVGRYINPLRTKREWVRKHSIRVEEKRKTSGGKREALYIWGGKKNILLEGTQAMPARPSDKGRMGVKTLGLWVVKAWDRYGRILFHDSLLSVDIIWKWTNFVALEQGNNFDEFT
jgi:hypothetical protein